MRRNDIRVLLAIAGFGLSGCGGSNLDGFARVRVGLGGNALMDSPFSGLVGQGTACTLPAFRVVVDGPNMAPVVQDLTVTALINDNYFSANAISGTGLFSAPIFTDLQIPKGLNRRIWVHGIFYDDCTKGVQGVQIGGYSDGLSVTTDSVTFSVDAVAQTSSISTSPTVISLVNNKFVHLKIPNIPNAVSQSLGMNMEIANFYSILPVPITGANPVKNTYYIGPLMPYRRYTLHYFGTTLKPGRDFCIDTGAPGTQITTLDWTSDPAVCALP
jgi:hypothetical protein